MNMEKLTIIIKKDKDGYVAEVKELKGCITQGDTLSETLDNLKEAIELYLKTTGGKFKYKNGGEENV